MTTKTFIRQTGRFGWVATKWWSTLAVAVYLTVPAWTLNAQAAPSPKLNQKPSEVSRLAQQTDSHRDSPDEPAPILLAKAEQGNSATNARRERKPDPKEKCEDCKITVKGLDLSRPPTEKELRMAGQLGGALSPTGPADHAKIADPAKRKKQEADNLLFGKAMQAWNTHKYNEAVKLFKQHRKAYADSPWAGEAELHLGCEARFSGRYDEAQKSFQSILDKHPGTDVAKKAKLRMSVLYALKGDFDKSQRSFADMLGSDTDFRRVTYARHWLKRLGLYKDQAATLRACGSQTLAYIVAASGDKGKAQAIRQLVPDGKRGFSLQELAEIANANGLRTKGVQASVRQLNRLPTPFIAHYNELHFVAVMEVSKQKLRLYDSTLGHEVQMTPHQFAKQWSGKALLLSQPASRLMRVATLSQTEMSEIIGGCCGVETPPDYDDCGTGGSGSSGTGFGDGSPGNGGGNGDSGPGNGGGNGDSGPGPGNGGGTGDSGPGPGNGGGTGDSGPGPGNGGGAGDSGPGTGGGNCSTCGSPQWNVNLRSLNVAVQDVPLWYQNTIGPDVGIQLSYNSEDSINVWNPFGNKWMFNYSSYLTEAPASGTNGTIMVVMPNGVADIYTPQPDGSYQPPARRFNKLTKIDSTTYTLEFTDGTIYHYALPTAQAQQPFLTAMEDKNGNTLSFTYNEDVQLTTITDALGRETTLVYNQDGRVSEVHDPFGRVAYFEYDVAGNWVECTDMGGVTYGFEYDETGFITAIHKPQGTWTFEYSFPDNVEQGTWDRFSVTVSDPLGYKQVFEWTAGAVGGSFTLYADKNGNLTKDHIKIVSGTSLRGVVDYEQYPDGTRVSYLYNEHDQPLAITNEDGYVTLRTYNSQGRVLTRTDARTNTTTYAYATNGLDIVTVTDALSNVTAQMTYDTKRNRTSTTDALSNTTVFVYNSFGQIDSVTNALGEATIYEYNSLQQMTQIIRGTNTLASMTYDDIGRLRTRTDADGMTLTYDYDHLNRVTRVTYADNTFFQNIWNCCFLEQEIDRMGNATWFTYDALGRLTSSRDAMNRVIRQEYDPNGNLIALIDSSGNRTRWEYDNLGRLVKKIYADNSSYTYTYDGVGNLKTRTDAKGITTTYSYDANDNLTLVDYPTTPDMSFGYDALNHRVQITDGVGTTIYSYDAASRLTSFDGPWSNDNVTYEYNEIGQLTNMMINGQNETTYSYDDLDRLDALTNPAGEFRYAYIGQGSLVQQLLLPNGTHVDYAYDGLKRLTQIANIRSDDSVISSFVYTYNDSDVRTSETRADGEVINYGHDKVYQLASAVSSSEPSAFSFQYSYDRMGNRLQAQRPSGAISYQHNNLNQMTLRQFGGSIRVTGEADEHLQSLAVAGIPTHQKTDKTFESPPVTLQAGTNDLRTVAVDLAGNFATNITTLVVSPNTSTFTYDLNGNLLNDGTRSFVYDEENRLVAVTNGTHRSEFAYDGLGRRVELREYENSQLQTTTRHIYQGYSIVEDRDGNDTVQVFYTSGLSYTKFGASDAGDYFYIYDGNVNVVEVTDSSQQTVAHYKYDPFGGRLVATGAQSSQPYQFGLLRNHAPSGLDFAVFRAYDSNSGRWTTRDPIEERGGVNLYAYVANNAIDQLDPNGLEFPTVGSPVPPSMPTNPNYQDIKAAYKKIWDSCKCGENPDPGDCLNICDWITSGWIIAWVSCYNKCLDCFPSSTFYSWWTF